MERFVQLLKKRGGVFMKRTAEKVLGIISAVLTLLGIFLSFAFSAIMKLMTNDEDIIGEFEAELYADPQINPEDVEIILSVVNTVEKFGTVAGVLFILSLVLTIIALVAVWNNKNVTLAGVMFIVSGLLAFVLTPMSIMLYIAGILCFTRKAPPADMIDTNQDSEYEAMRPL